jgi:gluconokinase
MDLLLPVSPAQWECNGRATAREGARVVVIVMGVSGAGKTTVGTHLARALGWTFRDADEFHPARNIAKMHAGEPLTDADREPWLERMRALLRETLGGGGHLVLACSALKEAYRERLTVDPVRQRWVFLHASRELLTERLAHREGHFMAASLLDSQLETLEPPEGALVVDVTPPPDAIVERILGALDLPPPVQPPG